MVDASIALAWYIGEACAIADRTLGRLSEERGLAPAAWPLEIANVLLMGRRTGRFSQQRADEIAQRLLALPVDVEAPSDAASLLRVISLGHAHRLTSYEASYLELAIRHVATLATLDKALARAAKREGVELV